MSVISKSMLVAAALVLVGFGAAGAVWAKGNRFFVPPQIYVCRGDIEIPNPVASVPRAAFNDHVWVNSTLVQAPKYVDVPNARLVVKPKETEADIAHGRKIVEEIMARIPKSSAETPEGVVGGCGVSRPRFAFHLCGPSLDARYPSGNRPTYAHPVVAGKNPLGVSSPAPVSSSGVEPNSVSQPSLKASAPASSLNGH